MSCNRFFRIKVSDADYCRRPVQVVVWPGPEDSWEKLQPPAGPEINEGGAQSGWMDEGSYKYSSKEGTTVK